MNVVCVCVVWIIVCACVFVRSTHSVAAQDVSRSKDPSKLEEPAQFIDYMKHHDRIDSDFLSSLKSKLRHHTFRRTFLDLEGWRVHMRYRCLCCIAVPTSICLCICVRCYLCVCVCV